MSARTPIDLALLRRRLAPLQAGWSRQARRIDALSLRERAFFFLCIVAVIAALFDAAVLSPLSARSQQRREAEAQQAAELKLLREQFIAASNNAGDPANQLRQQLEASQAERARLDAGLRQASSVNSGEGLAAVLQRLLAQQPGLVLERVALLDEAPVVAPAGGASAAAPQPGLPGMTWQGVALQVQGSYGDIQRYVQSLERELPGLRWGSMHLTAPGANETRPRLSAQVFLLKVQP